MVDALEIEDTLAEKDRLEELEMTFSYESKAGEKITKDSKWLLNRIHITLSILGFNIRKLS